MQSKITEKREVSTFRCFSRKGYALFSCLGREVRIGVLSAATLLCAAPRLEAGNQFPSRPIDKAAPDTLQLGETVVSASRAPMAATLAARQVTTLTRRDIEAAGVTSINDLLKTAVGVDVRQRGGFGIQSDISIDGGTFDQITILVNGIPINNPQSGHNAADFPVNLSDIQRVEILEGAAARVFGSQAFSGAVNIVTRRDSQPLEISASGGSYGTAQAEARTAWAVRGFQTSASLRYSRSDGAVTNSAFDGTKAYWQGAYEDERFRLETQAGATINDFEANTFYSAAYPDQWEATRRYLLSARGESKGRIHLYGQLSWLRSLDHYQLIRHSQTGENFHRNDVFTTGVGAWLSWAAGRTAFGAELRQEGIYSTNLGRPLDESLQIPVRGEKDIRYTKKDDRTNVSYFLEHNLILRRWTLSAGVMAQRNTASDPSFGFYPGIDLSFRPGRGWKLFASWNKSLRLPTFTDLYYKSPTQEGNTGLRPEESTVWRLGAEWRTAVARLSLGAYFNQGRHMIDWVMYSPEDIYHATAFRLDNMGASGAVDLDLQQWWGRKQPFTRFTLAYAYIHQRRHDDQPVYKSNYALEYLRHKFVATLDHRIVSRLSAAWKLRVQKREGNYLRYQNATATGELVPYAAYAQLDCKVTWAERRYNLFLDLTNLTAKRYYDLGNVRQPGFILMAGISFKI